MDKKIAFFIAVATAMSEMRCGDFSMLSTNGDSTSAAHNTTSAAHNTTTNTLGGSSSFGGILFGQQNSTGSATVNSHNTNSSSSFGSLSSFGGSLSGGSLSGSIASPSPATQPTAQTPSAPAIPSTSAAPVAPTTTVGVPSCSASKSTDAVPYTCCANYPSADAESWLNTFAQSELAAMWASVGKVPTALDTINASSSATSVADMQAQITLYNTVTSTVIAALQDVGTLYQKINNQLDTERSQQAQLAEQASPCQAQQKARVAATDVYNKELAAKNAQIQNLNQLYNNLNWLINTYAVTVPYIDASGETQKTMTAQAANMLLLNTSLYDSMVALWKTWYSQCTADRLVSPQKTYIQDVYKACAQWCQNSVESCQNLVNNAGASTQDVINTYCMNKANVKIQCPDAQHMAAQPGWKCYWQQEGGQFTQEYNKKVEAYNQAVKNCPVWQQQLAQALSLWNMPQNILFTWAYNERAHIQKYLDQVNALNIPQAPTFVFESIDAPSITQTALGGNASTAYYQASQWSTNSTSVTKNYVTVQRAMQIINTYRQSIQADISNYENWASYKNMQAAAKAVTTCNTQHGLASTTAAYNLNNNQVYANQINTLMGCLNSLQATLANRVFSISQAVQSMTISKAMQQTSQSTGQTFSLETSLPVSIGGLLISGIMMFVMSKMHGKEPTDAEKAQIESKTDSLTKDASIEPEPAQPASQATENELQNNVNKATEPVTSSDSSLSASGGNNISEPASLSGSVQPEPVAPPSGADSSGAGDTIEGGLDSDISTKTPAEENPLGEAGDEDFAE